jgi:hypothetical protein
MTTSGLLCIAASYNPRRYSITSSASASSFSGIVRPSALDGLEVDDQLELGGLHDRHVCWLLALENAAHIDADLADRV